jgi:hypothetical protein
VGRCGLDLSGSGHVPLVCSCEDVDDTFASINVRNF